MRIVTIIAGCTDSLAVETRYHPDCWHKYTTKWWKMVKRSAKKCSSDESEPAYVFLCKESYF